MSEPELQIYEGGPMHRWARPGAGPDAEAVAHAVTDDGNLAYMGQQPAGFAVYRRNSDNPGQWDYVPEKSTGPTTGPMTRASLNA